MDFRSEILDYTTRFEEVLTERYGAVGSGLCSKTKNVRSKLPSWLVDRLCFVGRVRNLATHRFVIPDATKSDAIKACKALEVDLDLPPLVPPPESEQKSSVPMPPSQPEAMTARFGFVPPNTVDSNIAQLTNRTRPRDVVAIIAILMVVVSLIGALFMGGFTTPVQQGFDIPRGLWPFDWTEHAVKSTDVYNGCFYLLWIGGGVFIVSRFLD